MTRRLFISSTQGELAAERRAIVEHVRKSPQLARFFSTFAFEFDVPAADKRTDEVYLSELAVSDLYICLVGDTYGGVTPLGVSATESEYDEATRLGLPRFVFVKGLDDGKRERRELEFLRKVSPTLIRVRFSTTEELISAVVESLDRYLAESRIAYSGLSYEEEAVGKWTDLDREKIRWFVRTARRERGFPCSEEDPIEKILTYLKMVTDGVPNRAAMLCFGRDAHLYATSPGVKCVLWYGTERRKPIASYKWYEGNLFDVSDQAIAFVKEKLNLRIGGHTMGAQSEDSLEIDPRVIAEMVNNGIAHRDYASSATVQVELFKDRLVVFSPGAMHKDMTVEQLSELHPSCAVNPIIARALYYVKYIEELGSGTVDMFDICRSSGLRPPIFDVNARQFTVTVFRPTFDEQGQQVGGKAAEVGGKAADVGGKAAEVGGKAAEVGGKQLLDEMMAGYRKDFRETCYRVWCLLLQDETLFQQDVSTRLKIAYSSVLSAYNALREVGLLERAGVGRGSRWIIRRDRMDQSAARSGGALGDRPLPNKGNEEISRRTK